jgi:hypothetical protein
MLGGKRAGKGTRLLICRRQDNAPLPRQRLGDDVGAAQRLQLAANLHLHRLRQGAGRGEQDGRRQHIMLRLRQHIRRHPCGVGGFIGHDDGFGGAIQAIYAHTAVNFPLGKGDKQITRADDFIHTGQTLCAKASAPIACAPPTVMILSTPTMWAAARMTSGMSRRFCPAGWR